MSKTEVYSWRVTPEMKRDLEEVARREKQSLSSLLEGIVRERLEEYRAETINDGAEQKRLHRAAARHFGKIRGGDPSRSERVRDAVRARLAKRRGR